MPTPESLLAEADALLDIEHATADEATVAFRRKLDALTKQLTVEWTRLYGGADARPRNTVAAELLETALTKLRSAQAGLAITARSAIVNGADEALNHGIDTALDAFPRGVRQVRPPRAAAARVGDEVASLVQAGRERARELLKPANVKTLVQLLVAVHSGGERTANDIERLARTTVNAASTSAALAVAKANGTGSLWVAERDACRHCLAYSGRYSPPATPYPADLTFGSKPLEQAEPLDGPPLHPNCRCTIRPWVPEWDAELPAALEREARRSVALGFRLPTESTGARLKAADKLLAGSPGLPKTVVARAKRAVAAGTFADRRTP